jgi:Na+/melibiose symporter-like transporter
MSEIPDAPQPTASPEHQAKSAFAAFRHPAFLVIWMATVVANIGSWMYSAASGWLMTSLHGDALSVALVQVASSLPISLFAIPAGALADILDKRRFLIIGEMAYTLISAAFAVLVWRLGDAVRSARLYVLDRCGGRGDRPGVAGDCAATRSSA